MEVKVYNQAGAEIGKQQLDPKIFGVKPKAELIQQVVIGILANRRNVLAHTKTRGEVRGGGRKPWRQKGTGRARQGSIRAPQWRGGGIVFGPTNKRVYQVKINKKVRRKALLMALTDKAQNNSLILVDKIEIPEIKTKNAFTILKNLKLRLTKKEVKVSSGAKKEAKKESKEVKPVEKSALLVVPPKNNNIFKSFRNIPKVEVVTPNSLDVYSVLKHNYLIIAVPCLELISKIYSK